MSNSFATFTGLDPEAKTEVLENIKKLFDSVDLEKITFCEQNSTGGPTLFFYQAAEPANPFGVTVGSYGSGWIVATWEQSAKSSRALYVDTTQTVIATAFTKYRTFIDLLQWCREGTTAADFDVAFAACFPRQLNAYERAAMQRHAGRIVGRAL